MLIAKKIIIGLGLLIGLVISYFVTIIFFPVLQVPKQPMPTSTAIAKEKSPTYRHDVAFDVQNTRIRAWLYLPQDADGAMPCVVLTNGFGGTKDMILERYAKRFVKAGLAVLTFDFRHFGASEGTPRQLFSLTYQLEDFRAAIEFARSRQEIDPDKIALWSTSGSGGYGLMIAAQDHRIAAIIAHVASIDYEQDKTLENNGIKYIVRLIMHAQRDKGRAWFGLSPHTIPAYGKPGTFAFSSEPGVFEGLALLASGSDFVNEICARSILLMEHDTDPVEASKTVRCPALFLVSEQDEIVPRTSHARAADNLGELAVVKSFPVGHFDLYTGEYFEQSIHEQILFLTSIFSIEEELP